MGKFVRNGLASLQLLPISFFHFLCKHHFLYKNASFIHWLFIFLHLNSLFYLYIVRLLYCSSCIYYLLFICSFLYLDAHMCVYCYIACGIPRWVSYLYLDTLWKVPLGERTHHFQASENNVFIVPFILLLIYLYYLYLLVYIYLFIFIYSSPLPLLIYCTLYCFLYYSIYIYTYIVLYCVLLSLITQKYFISIFPK